MNEDWKEIPGWPGYEASSLGCVRSQRGIKAPFKDPKGYLKVKLWSHSKSKNMRVSGLVALAFHGLAPAGHVVRKPGGKASISYVQRMLRIGYNRAARLLEDMEKAGAVSPMDSSGSRTVLAQGGAA